MGALQRKVLKLSQETCAGGAILNVLLGCVQNFYWFGWKMFISKIDSISTNTLGRWGTLISLVSVSEKCWQDARVEHIDSCHLNFHSGNNYNGDQWSILKIRFPDEFIQSA